MSSSTRAATVVGIPEWYAGQRVLITGATGFMGKVLVEKLLRDCSDIETLYLLIRTKQGIEPKQRLEEYLRCRAFDFVRKNNPSAFEKIIIVKGDVTLDDLGVSAEDRDELIANVTTVFHCAACVRFDQPLRETVNLNTMGTHRMLSMAEYMPNLKVFVHVSTAYCQCKEIVVEEKGYPPPHNPHGIIQMTKMLDNQVLKAMTPALLDTLPNTYAYTKALTEGLVAEFNGKMPIVIARPSIVTAAIKEPLPGWVEGMNGPTGLLVGAGRGVLRTMHCAPDYPADIMPVDLTINALIAIAWDRGQNTSKEIEYVNVTHSDENHLTWGQTIEVGQEQIYKYPFEFSLWYPDGSIKSSYYYHSLCVIFFHLLPAYFIDAMLFLCGQKTFMIRIQKKISDGLELLQYYTTKAWIFRNDNMRALREKINDRDKETFDFDMRKLNWREYIKFYILGTREFVLKEKPETLPKARILLKRLRFMDRAVTAIFYVLGLYLLWAYFDYILSACQFVFRTASGIIPR